MLVIIIIIIIIITIITMIIMMIRAIIKGNHQRPNCSGVATKGGL